MGHYRTRRMVRPRPPGELTIEQLTGELAEARRKIAHYAAISKLAPGDNILMIIHNAVAYQEHELKMLRDSMCQGCMDRREAAYPGQEHQHGDCGHGFSLTRG